VSPDARAPGRRQDGETVQGDPASSVARDDAAYGVPATAATTPVRFAGGPWDGRRARYVDVVRPTPMPCPGGRYWPREWEPDGTIVYAFTAG
jgi:hypothetical protein